LGILIREEGYAGEFFIPGDADSLANAIEKILINDEYRIQLGMTNYEAACSLPMDLIADKYLAYFNEIRNKKSKKQSVSNKPESGFRVPQTV